MIRDKSAAVAVHANELSTGTNESRELSSQLAASVGSMALGAETQAAGAIDVASSMVEMASSVGWIADSSAIMASASGDMLKEAECGNEKSDMAVGQMERLRSATSSISNVIVQLNDRSSDIHQMADTISEIASQTNLLALNAAIEAARAGEHGLGFAVVSSAVRKLAKQSSASAAQIAETINQALALTAHAVVEMNIGETEMEQGRKSVGELKQAFDAILLQSKEVASQIQDVSAATEEMAAGSEEISASVDTMAKVAHTTSVNAARSAADTSLQDQLAENTLTRASSVNELAEQLQESIRRFRLE